jgi:uncharacterized membrane protein
MMTQKQINYICLGISMLPFIFYVFVQNRMIEFPSTHLFADNSINPAPIDKQMFMYLILLSGMGFYFLSLIASRYSYLISTKMNIVYFRVFLNAILILPAFLLILKNLK